MLALVALLQGHGLPEGARLCGWVAGAYGDDVDDWADVGVGEVLAGAQDGGRDGGVREVDGDGGACCKVGNHGACVFFCAAVSVNNYYGTSTGFLD